MNARTRFIAGCNVVAAAAMLCIAACAGEAAPKGAKVAHVEGEGTGVTRVPGDSKEPQKAESHHSESGATQENGAAEPAHLREVFPHIRLDAKAGVLELDASVSIDAHDDNHPDVYLETLVCIPDSKEYESLLVTPAKPSHVHAALLLMGLNPGRPGRWVWEGEHVRGEAPAGPALRVRFVVGAKEFAPGAWVRDRKTGTLMLDSPGGDSFVFAGSVMVGQEGRQHYKADVEGCLVGLTTFGSETIAWTQMSNPESATEEPHWVAAPSMPNFGDTVTVRITREDANKP